jgi:hypothetical protein
LGPLGGDEGIDERDLVGPVGWNSRRNTAVRASSSARFSPGMMWDSACMPDFKAFREQAALPSGEVGPVDFWEFSRLALICAWEDMLEPRVGSGMRNVRGAALSYFQLSMRVREFRRVMGWMLLKGCGMGVSKKRLTPGRTLNRR